MALRRPLVLTSGAHGELPNGDQLPIDSLQLPQGYIDGLQMKWVGPNAVTVTSGACYIEGAGKVVANAADMPLTGLALPASSFSHLYAYVSGGVLAIEASSTAPASPYNGTARSKTGDASRRYVGSVKTDGGGNIYAFKHHPGGLIVYMASIRFAPFLVVDNGAATSPTSFSVSALVPVTSVAAVMQARNTDSSVAVVFGTSDQGYTLDPNAFQSLLDPLSAFVAVVNTNASQAAQYMFRSAPTGTCSIRVVGYEFAR